MILITLTCIAILISWFRGEDVKSKLDELKNTDWGKSALEIFSTIKEYSKKIGRFACGNALKLWFVLLDSRTTTLEKALSCGAIIYIISEGSFIPVRVYKLLGLADEGLAVAYVIDKVKDKMTPAIENKVKDVLDEWFGPEYSISDAKA